MIIDILLILAFTTLITEQVIGRRIVNYILNFKPENYLQLNGTKRFFIDLLSCPVCTSFHIGYLYHLVVYGLTDLYSTFTYAMVSMVISSIIEKLKR